MTDPPATPLTNQVNEIRRITATCEKNHELITIKFDKWR